MKFLNNKVGDFMSKNRKLKKEKLRIAPFTGSISALDRVLAAFKGNPVFLLNCICRAAARLMKNMGIGITYVVGCLDGVIRFGGLYILGGNCVGHFGGL